LNKHKREAFKLFEAMLANLRQNITSVISHVELRVQPEPVFAMASGNGTDRGGPRPAAPRGPLGRHPAQRPMPLRVGEEIQALPRPGVTPSENSRRS